MGFTRACVWTVVLGHFTQNVQQYFADWFPTFYSELGLGADAIAFNVAMIYAVELPSRTATKGLPSDLSKRGWSLLATRKAMSIGGFGSHAALYAVLAGMLASGLNWPLVFTV